MEMKKTVKVLLVGLGGLLICVSLLGDFTSLGYYESGEPYRGERFDKTLVGSIRSIDALSAAAFAEIENPSLLREEQKMQLLYEVFINRFTHSEGARHSFMSNWLLFFAGKILYPLGYIWDHELLLSRGHSLVCSQSSYLLIHVAIANGMIARHVGLNGHVVMEVWYDNEWHMYDPDSEVLVKDKSGVILSVEEIARDLELMKNVYVGVQKGMIPIFASREDNSFVSYPPGTYFEWKSQVLLYVEKLMQILKYFLPLCLILAGMVLHVSNTRHPGKDKGRRFQ